MEGFYKQEGLAGELLSKKKKKKKERKKELCMESRIHILLSAYPGVSTVYYKRRELKKYFI